MAESTNPAPAPAALTPTPAPAARKQAVAATVPSGSTVQVQAAAAPADPGPMRRVVAVAALQGGTLTDPVAVAPGAETELPAKEAARLVSLGLARWPGEAALALSPYDEAVKDTTAKIGEGKAAEADQRAEEH